MNFYEEREKDRKKDKEKIKRLIIGKITNHDFIYDHIHSEWSLYQTTQLDYEKLADFLTELLLDPVKTRELLSQF
jgi:hypothetical protein